MNVYNHLEPLLVVRYDDLIPERQHVGVVVLMPEEDEAV